MIYVQMPAKFFSMEKVVPILFNRLMHKGLDPEKIPRLIEDVLAVVPDSDYFTVKDIKQGLKHMGWSPIVDSNTIELILCFLQVKGKYEVQSYALQ